MSTTFVCTHYEMECIVILKTMRPTLCVRVRKKAPEACPKLVCILKYYLQSNFLTGKWGTTRIIFVRKENKITLFNNFLSSLSVFDTRSQEYHNACESFLFTKYSRSFLKLQLNHWCHMDYFNDVLTTFLGLTCGSYIAVYAGSESSRFQYQYQKYLNLCSEDERSYRFITALRGVINDRLCIIGLTFPLCGHVSNSANFLQCYNKY